MYAHAQSSDELTRQEKNRLHGMALGAYYMDYMYPEAEEIANLLCKEEDLPWQVYVNLAKYYTTTRRYDTSDRLIEKALNKFGNTVLGLPHGVVNYLKSAGRFVHEQCTYFLVVLIAEIFFRNSISCFR